jgi:hypothetical protein
MATCPPQVQWFDAASTVADHFSIAAAADRSIDMIRKARKEATRQSVDGP